MAFPFPQYAQIKDRYCISYTGSHIEYTIQLLHLRPAIEQELPGIQIWICCPDHLSYLATSYERIVYATEIQERKKEFAYIRQLKGSQIQHPIWELLEESKLLLPTLSQPTPHNQELKTCGIYPRGDLPVKSLNGEQTEGLKRLAKTKGYHPMVDADIETCGWAIGVENEAIFRAGIAGIRTSLVPTGAGTRLYQKMFPAGEVMKLIF